MSDSGFRDAWEAWHAARLKGAVAPHGPAALTLTYWVTPERSHEIPGVVGSWEAVDGGIAGRGLEASGYLDQAGAAVGESATLSPSGATELFAGERRLRLFERDGAFALRVFDPEALGRVGLEAIEHFEPDEAWRLPAVFEPEPQDRRIELVDGYQRTVGTSGSIVFEIDGQPHRLTATQRPNELSVVFGDLTNGEESHGFRFLTTQLPDERGALTIDFNRAFLPPCAFSDHFVCPLPTPENRLPLRIPAGERTVRRG